MQIQDMQLTAEEQQRLAEDALSYGEDWAKRREFILKARLYARTFLTSKQLSQGRPFRCYTEGEDQWQRQDGAPLTQEDLSAIQQTSIGQGSTIKGQAGDLTVIHSWFCDSSD